VVCVGLLLAVLLSSGFLHERKAERGEFYALMLFAAAGMSLLVISNELITLFVSLEVLSVATYALTAYLRRGPRPAEAGFKYFVLGAFAGATLLYGTALLYGATGSTHLSRISVALPSAFATSPALVWCGVFLVGAGFAFKVAAVPFHMWTPDVYEGAPTPVTALMSAGVKAAAFAGLCRVFLALAPGLGGQRLVAPFALLAFLTMVLGNLLALPQRNVKRMLAYSSIAHAGYLLVGVVSAAAAGARPVALAGVLFYLAAYTATAIGAFAVVGALERRGKPDDEPEDTWDLDRFAGLAQRRPVLAFAMTVFLLSLAGVPPTAGFVGKLYIFKAAVGGGLYGLAILGVLTSALGAYYYLRVVVYMYMRPAEGEEPVLSSPAMTVALVAAVAVVVVLGVAPDAMVRLAQAASSIVL